MIRLISVGDIIGKAGRITLKRCLPAIRKEFTPDGLIVNGENAAGGFGLTRKVYDEFTKNLSVDAVTMGNHWHDKSEIYDYAKSVDRLILPGNMMNVRNPSDGLRIIELGSGVSIAVMNLVGKAFMHADNRNPFHTIDKLFQEIPDRVKIRIVDMHAEATSEKQGMGFHLGRKASLVYGTHSHVPTADERIIDDWTGFITDIGMTGAYDSVIGMKKSTALDRMTETGTNKRFEPAKGNPWICFIVSDFDEKTGQCINIQRHQWRSGDIEKISQDKES